MEIKGKSGLLSQGDSLEELARLARTAGATVVGAVLQRLDRPSKSYLGKGKLEELRDVVDRARASVVMLDDELTPSQQEQLERALPTKVIDRSALILDIFARRARTREGRLQVELAQHEYLLPRLAGQWSHLERLGGGIGTRGPGEAQIETDRRLIRRRIQRLRGELDHVRTHRALYRARRKEQGFPVVCLVGYTNAGKSTLFNAIGKAATLVEDKLFATLDPTTRRAQFASGRPFLLTDTVGFIHKLPHGLLAAFRATLEELEGADLLLHVVDISHPNAAEQARVVRDTLREMGLEGKPLVTACNKIDLLAPAGQTDEGIDAVADVSGGRLAIPEQPAVFISAAKKLGIGPLLREMEAALERPVAPAAYEGEESPAALPYPAALTPG